MSGGHVIGPELPCLDGKGIELYLPVAQYVRVGSPAFLIFREHIIDNPLPVCIAQIDEMPWYAQLFCNHLREHCIIFPVAVALKQASGVVPVSHEKSFHIIAFLQQQPGRNARVNTP